MQVAVLLFISCARALKVADFGAASVGKISPQDNKDAFFSVAPHFYGVFDGVSQGQESRAYAQTLAKESIAALSESSMEDNWTDLARRALLQGTQAADSYSGMSTALLLQIDLARAQACTYSLGDCCCLVLREEQGQLVVGDCSCVQYHDNGAPYQFGGSEWISDSVDDGEFETFAISAGDVLLCFSDGVSGNLALNDIAQIVNSCAAQSAETVAQTVVNEARERQLVVDDITVVAVRLGESAGPAVAVGASSTGVVSAPDSAQTPPPTVPPVPPASPPSSPPAAPEGLDGLKGALGGWFEKAANAALDQAKASAKAAAEAAAEQAKAAAKAAAEQAKNSMSQKKKDGE